VESAAIRVDTGVVEGDEISIHYDPMIAKVIAHGATRAEAIQHLRAALDEYYVRGLSHNIGFLAALASHPRFAEGRLSTSFIAQEYPDGFDPARVSHYDPALLIVIAAVIHRRYLQRDGSLSGQLRGLEYRVSNEWVVAANGQEYQVTVKPDREGDHDANAYVVTQNGKTYHIRTEWQFRHPLWRGEINGERVCVDFERRNMLYVLRHRGTQVEALVLTPFAAKLNRYMLQRTPPNLSRYLLSPMPGLLVSVSVKAGDEVKDGDKLAVVEAMKMEIVLRATQDRRVKAVLAEAGAGLAVDQPILEFEEDAAPADA
jgi:propionyl-CoA carboxylase alpha chain